MSASARSGPGTDTVVIGREEGLIVFAFQQPVQWVKLDPQTALRVATAIANKASETQGSEAAAEAIRRMAYVDQYGTKPNSGVSLNLESIRVKCRNRVALMLRGFMGRTPIPSFEMQANEIVDAVLKEAT